MGSQPNGPFDLAPVYEPEAVEARWYPEWERRGYFGASAGSDRSPFCIVLPPPNVTGALHMGHAFQQLLQDIVIRRKRMQGFETLWLPGTDHAGIATQVVVERELAKEGIDRRAIGREAFVERVWAWKEQYGGRIVEQMRALGNSCDWTRLRFTMDEGLAHAVRVAFVRMYEDGLIYRGERIINWCPHDGTALSDSEVNHEDVDGELRDVPLRPGGRVRARRCGHHAGRRPCSATPGSRSIRATSGTQRWWAARPCTRSTAAASRSWPTTRSTRPSAPAR